MIQRFSIDTIRDPKQLYPLIQQLSNDLDTAQRRIADLQIAASRPILSLNTLATIRDSLQSLGATPLNIAQLPGILAQSQRGYAVVADSASTLPSPTLYEVGTLGAVLSGTTLTFYLVAEGMPRSWIAQTSLAVTAIDNSFTIEDDADTTKRIRFEASSITTGNTRVQTVPDTNQILAGRNVDNAFSALQSFAAGWSLLGGNGSLLTPTFASEEITLSTSGVTTDSVANLIPSSSFVVAVCGFVTQTISGGGVTTIQVGDAVTPSVSRFFTTASLTAGNAFTGMDQLLGGVATDAAGPLLYSASKIRLTADATPTQGRVRVVVYCLSATAPTS